MSPEPPTPEDDQPPENHQPAPEATQPPPETKLRRVLTVLLSPSVLSVFVLVGLWNISVSSGFMSRQLNQPGGGLRETLRELRDVNLYVQLRLYNWLAGGRPIKMTNKNVTLVWIDDDTHWDYLKGTLPTNRMFLASLIRQLSQKDRHASVIGLDIELLAPRNLPEGAPDPPRVDDNKALLDAIQQATVNGVPIVLGGTYIIDEAGKFVRVPSLFSPAQLRARGTIERHGTTYPIVGYLNGPEDKRLIAVPRQVVQPDGTSAPMESLASAVAKADPRGVEAVEEDGLFGSFLPEMENVSALNVLYGLPDAVDKCNGRIVLIGGKWRDQAGRGNTVDVHLSPVGNLSGLLFHANYIESLLQGQFAHEVSLGWGIVIDLLIGLGIYTAFALRVGSISYLILSIGLIAPIAAAWAFLWTANLYLDFLFPIELYCLHIVYELAAEKVERLWKTEH